MKKLLFTAVSALALAGVATAADSTQFGALPVNSASKRTLVAVPWVEASTGGSNIAVSNLVLTANLTAGDTLDVLGSHGESLNRWLLTAGVGGVLYWNSVTMVTEGDNKGSNVSSTPPANVETMQRGSAVVLIRQKYVYAQGDSIPDGKKVGDAIPFYVMGQVAGDTISTAIVAGSAQNPCYNMIAPPSTVAQTLNGGDHGATWAGTIDPEDRIFIGKDSGWTSEIKYTNGMWSVYKTVVEGGLTSKQWKEYTTAIPVGTGLWYVSKGGSPTVTWKDVPTAVK